MSGSANALHPTLELHVRNIVTRLRLCYCVAQYHESSLPLPGQDD